MTIEPGDIKAEPMTAASVAADPDAAVAMIVDLQARIKALESGKPLNEPGTYQVLRDQDGAEVARAIGPTGLIDSWRKVAYDATNAISGEDREKQADEILGRMAEWQMVQSGQWKLDTEVVS